MGGSKYRVIGWSTGQVGVEVVRSVLDHPSLELAGLWVHSESKDGRDAGELCGRGSTGVLATRDVDALLAVDADCICYTATDNNRSEEVVDDLCRIPQAACNVRRALRRGRRRDDRGEESVAA